MMPQHPRALVADASHDASDLDLQTDALNLLRRFFLAGPRDETLRAFAGIELAALDNQDAVLIGLGRMAEAVCDGLATAGYGERLRSEFTRLFEGPGEMPAVPFASYYLSRSRALMTSKTLAVRAQYLDAGLSVEALNRVPDDFVGIELEFVYFLTREALAARETGDAAALKTRLRQRHQFVAEHLMVWLPAFAEVIRTATHDRVFTELAAILRALPDHLL